MQGLMTVAEDTNASETFGLAGMNGDAGTSSHERIGASVGHGRNL